MMELDEKQISAIITGLAGIGGVLLGNSFVTIKEWFVTSGKIKKDATYLAVIVGSHLERYASRCADVAWDFGVDRGDGLSEAAYKPPEIKPLELDVEWKSIDQKLMYDILRIPDRQDQISRMLADDGYDDPPDYDAFFQDRRLAYAKLGLAVMEVIERLRKEAGLPSTDQWATEGDVDLANLLRKAVARVNADKAEAEKRRAEYRANNAALFEMLEAKRAEKAPGIPGASLGD